MARLTELEIALARNDFYELRADVAAFFESDGNYTDNFDDPSGALEGPTHDERIMRISDSAYRDPDKLLAYIALIAADATQLASHDAIAMGQLDSFLMGLGQRSIGEEEFERYFERLVVEARSNPVWSSILRTSCWWNLPRRYREELSRRLGFPPHP